jgi:predicted double-glycine peptidase
VIMSAWQEFATAVALSIGCFLFAYRVKSLCVCWVSIGAVGIASAWFFATSLTRVSNGLLLAAAVPVLTGSLFRFPLSVIVRAGLSFVTLAATAWCGWLDFLSPALCRPELSRLRTRVTSDGVCLQQTAYTCGPASAVTLLRKLGAPAEESEIALLAKSSSHAGTAPDELAAAICERFGDDGIHAKATTLENVEQLAPLLPALTVVEWNSILHHWVAVLEITESSVRFADPLSGTCEEPVAEFKRRWQYEAVRIWKERPDNQRIQPATAAGM